MLRKALLLALLLYLALPSDQFAQGKRDAVFYQIRSTAIQKARVDKNRKTAEYFIDVLLKESFHNEFEKLTRNNIGQFLAFLYKGKVVSPTIPTIQAGISNGRFYLGPFKNKSEVKVLLKNLKSIE